MSCLLFKAVSIHCSLRSSLIKVYTVCHSVRIFWIHYSLIKPHCSNFRNTTASFEGVQILWIFTYKLLWIPPLDDLCEFFKVLRHKKGRRWNCLVYLTHRVLIKVGMQWINNLMWFESDSRWRRNAMWVACKVLPFSTKWVASKVNVRPLTLHRTHYVQWMSEKFFSYY